MVDMHILEVLAGLSVVLVGYSALVGILQVAPDPKLRRLHAIRLSAVVLLPIVALVFCLLPFVLVGLGLPEASLWRPLSGALVLTCIGITAGFVSVNRRAVGSFVMDEPAHYWFSVIASFCVSALLCLGCLALIPLPAFGIYLAGVSWLVVEALHIFWVSFRAAIDSGVHEDAA